MTLIEVRVGGRLIGRCASRCYEAVNPKCECVCGGKNHGKGAVRAIQQTLVTRHGLIPPEWRDRGEIIFPLEAKSPEEIQRRVERERRRFRRIRITLRPLRGEEYMYPLFDNLAARIGIVYNHGPNPHERGNTPVP